MTSNLFYLKAICKIDVKIIFTLLIKNKIIQINYYNENDLIKT
jgi:hypothetical protein